MQMPSQETLRRAADDWGGVVIIGALLSAAMAENLYAVSQVMGNTLSISVQFVMAAACVTLETFGFVKARQCWRAGRGGAAFAMSFLTIVAIAVSLSNEATFYNVNFANTSQTLESKVDVAHDTAKEKAEIEARLARVGDIRPVAAINAAIAKELAQPVKGDRRSRSLGQLTRGCADTRSSSYRKCSTVFSLKSEAATAAVLLPQAEKDRARLEQIRSAGTWVTTIGVVRPGAAIIADVVNGVRSFIWSTSEKDHVSDKAVQTGIVTLLMAALQFANIILPVAWFGNTPKDTSEGSRLRARASGIHVDDGRVRSPANDDPTNANDNGYFRLWVAGTPILWQSRSDKSIDDVVPRADVGEHDVDDQVSPTSALFATNDVTVDVVNKNVNDAHEAVDARAQGVDVATEAFENTDVTAVIYTADGNDGRVIDLNDPKVAAVAAFRTRRCPHAAGASKRSDGIYAAYAAETPEALRFGRAYFTRVFRSLPGSPRLQLRRVDGRHWHIMDIHLNEAGFFAKAS